MFVARLIGEAGSWERQSRWLTQRVGEGEVMAGTREELVQHAETQAFVVDRSHPRFLLLRDPSIATDFAFAVQFLGVPDEAITARHTVGAQFLPKPAA